MGKAESDSEDFVENEVGSETNLTDKQLICWQLRSTGWSRERVAQELMVSTKTVSRWDADVKAYVGELPSTELARHHLQTLIPKCVEVLEEALNGDDIRLASEIANKILISNNVVKDRKHIEIDRDDTNATDSELIEEAKCIIEGKPTKRMKRSAAKDKRTDPLDLDGGDDPKEESNSPEIKD